MSTARDWLVEMLESESIARDHIARQKKAERAFKNAMYWKVLGKEHGRVGRRLRKWTRAFTHIEDKIEVMHNRRMERLKNL